MGDQINNKIQADLAMRDKYKLAAILLISDVLKMDFDHKEKNQNKNVAIGVNPRKLS